MVSTPSHPLTDIVDKPSPSLVSEARKRATTLEENLKTASHTNQVERKRLAAAHSELLSQCNSQEEVSEGSQPIKARLLQLAGKQKQLLECFKTQKEINMLLSKFEETSKLVSRSLADPSQMSGLVSNTDIAGGGRSSSSGVVARVANPLTLSAALPNLVQHLHQPTQGLQRNQSTTANPSQITRALLTQPSSASVLTSQAPSQLPQASLFNSQSNSSSNGRQMTTATQQPGGDGAAAKMPLSSDLAQPVPLLDLINHGFVKPGVDCISCVIMVIKFFCAATCRWVALPLDLIIII